MHVYNCNDQIEAFNEEYVLGKEIPVRKIRAKLSPFCKACSQLYFPFWAGSEIRVSFTRNLCYALNVANGTHATIKDVIFNGNSFPLFLVVAVENFKGIPLQGTKNCIPIPPIKEKTFCSHLNRYLDVTHFCFRNSYSTSVFKIQGSTLEKQLLACSECHRTTIEATLCYHA